jgi:lysophospholipase L1-like esterase
MLSKRQWRGIVVLFLVALITRCGAAQCNPASQWVETWASSQQAPAPSNQLERNAIAGAVFRQYVHLSLGGGCLRLRLSNAYGTEPLHLRSVHIALPDVAHHGQILPGSDRPLHFSGTADVRIPAGADYLSDEISFRTLPVSDIVVTIAFDEPPVVQTSHPGSRATSYLSHSANPGDISLAQAVPVEHWFQLSGVEIQTESEPIAVIAFGDSITDGRGSTTDANNRWPDLLASRFHSNPSTRCMAVLNQGVGGNRLLLDGIGPNALARFDQDVLAQTGARIVVLLEGINDLGTATLHSPISPSEHRALVARIEDAYRQIIVRAHAQRLLVYGGTLTPFGGSAYYHPDAANESDRRQVNDWIRQKGNFDGVIDFDHVLADPAHPDHLRTEFDSGDHLHPSPTGFQAMANAFPIPLLFTCDRDGQRAGRGE